ncbi:hypothetical protein Anas_01178, partial [Armadillidium nasatum]
LLGNTKKEYEKQVVEYSIKTQQQYLGNLGLRLLGIGRNQYIDLMNQCRSSRKIFRRRNVRELLPSLPKEITIEPWWIVKPGSITEEDIK